MRKNFSKTQVIILGVLLALLIACGTFLLLADVSLTQAEDAIIGNEVSALVIEERAFDVRVLVGAVAVGLLLLLPLLLGIKDFKLGNGNKTFSFVPLWLLAVVPAWQQYVFIGLGAVCVIVVIVISFKANKRAKERKSNSQTTEEQPPVAAVEAQQSAMQIDTDADTGYRIVDGKKFLYRFNYSFRAKLIQSGEDIQRRYGAIMDEFTACKAKTTSSWKQLRIYTGRQTLAMFSFRGKKLCIAFALDPADYADTKYHGVDMSSSKTFQKTPLMIKLSSDRQLGYALHLLSDLLQKFGLERGEVVASDYVIPYETTESLIEQGLVKVVEAGELDGVDATDQSGVDQASTDSVTTAEIVEPTPVASATDEQEGDQAVRIVDGKQIVYRYNFSFRAKLIQSGDEVQARYGAIMDAANACKKVKTTSSWKQFRLYTGRETLAMFSFRGKKLCVAFALDPADYADTKYHGVDMSSSKTFQKTPLMIKLSSDRQLGYALHLWAEVVAKYGLESGEIVESNFNLPYETTDALIEQGLVKVVEGEVDEPTVTADGAIVGDGEGEEPVSVQIEQQGEQVGDEATKVAPSAQDVIETSLDDEDAIDDDEEDEIDETKVEVVDGRQVFYHYNYSFHAKLIQSGEDVQSRYGAIMDQIYACSKIKTSLSWKQMSIYVGRKTLVAFTFRGRKLCIYFALNPKKYADAKYHCVDMSSSKAFQKTPLMLRLTSDLQLSYALYLLDELFAKNGLSKREVIPNEVDLPYESTEALIDQGLVKVTSNEQPDEGEPVVKADISMLVRDKITMREAQLALTNEVAATLIETVDEQASPDIAGETPQKGVTKGIINIDTLSANFSAGDVVTIKKMRDKNLIGKKVNYVKVLARGIINKPLTVYADDFSLDAVKMIALTGGHAIKK